MLAVVFIHGLNTYGDDDLHLGPIRLKKMYSPWEQALREHGCDVLSLTEFGTGPVWDVADQARDLILMRPWIKNKNKINLIGHSTGGLLARALATMPRLGEKISSIVTVGTPHHGTQIATQGLAFAEQHSHLQRLLSLVGYDTTTKASAFSQFTPEALQEFNRQCQLPPQARGAHALCQVSGGEISWPLRFLHSFVLPSGSASASEVACSDGFILSSSQTWCESLGEFGLDHFGNLGFFYQLRPSARRRARTEFLRLVDTTTKWMKKITV